MAQRRSAIIASHGEDADTSWADAMREELSCPICMDAVERAVQVPCGHVFCSDCLAINQSLGESRHDCPVCRTPFRSRGVTVADVARDTMRMLQRLVPGAAAAPAPAPTSPTSPTGYSDDAEDFEDESDDDNEETIGAGAAVEARFGGEEDWYPGSVKAVNADGTYQIAYDDGDEEDSVAPEYVRLRPAASESP